MNRILCTAKRDAGGVSVRLDGYIVANEYKKLYEWFGYCAVCPRDMHEALAAAKGKPVTAYINSYGGDVWAASVISTAIREYDAGVTTVIDGIAASAASVVAVAGKRVLMAPTAEMMIHNPSTYAEGDYREMDKASSSLATTKDAIINAYQQKTGMERGELSRLMNRETWMDAKEALAKGFIDEILFADESVADTQPADYAAVYNGAGLPTPDMLQQLKARMEHPNEGDGDYSITIDARAIADAKTVAHTVRGAPPGSDLPKDNNDALRKRLIAEIAALAAY